MDKNPLSEEQIVAALANVRQGQWLRFTFIGDPFPLAAVEFVYLSILQGFLSVRGGIAGMIQGKKLYLYTLPYIGVWLMDLDRKWDLRVEDNFTAEEFAWKMTGALESLEVVDMKATATQASVAA